MCSLWSQTQDIQMSAIRPYIIVQTNPQAINKGQPLTISGRLYDRDTNQPKIVSRIFMTIISLKDGHRVWDSEVVKKNDWKFDILIGTGDMKEGQHYEIRVSNNWNFSPMGATEFEIIKDATVPIILLPLVIPISQQILFLQEEIEKFDKEDNIREQLEEKLKEIEETNLREPVDDIKKKEIKLYIYRTEMDQRVCPICRPFSNKIYNPKEELVDIPQHPNCRCFYEIVYKDQFDASFNEILDVVQVAHIANTANNTLKIINAIEVMT
jgi:SPP1 gp7 family putative phage head morphogenesis protein